MLPKRTPASQADAAWSLTKSKILLVLEIIINSFFLLASFGMQSSQWSYPSLSLHVISCHPLLLLLSHTRLSSSNRTNCILPFACICFLIPSTYPLQYTPTGIFITVRIMFSYLPLQPQCFITMPIFNIGIQCMFTEWVFYPLILDTSWFWLISLKFGHFALLSWPFHLLIICLCSLLCAENWYF